MPEDEDESVARGALSAVRAKLSPRPSLADIVAEGLYIAAAATRLALKNRILVDILSAGEGFDADRFVPDAKETLLALAAEAEADAERAERERKLARRRFSDSDGTHDYRSRDVRNLRRRRKQSERIAQELRERAEDTDELVALVEAAREAAWSEVARNIDSTLRIEAARPDLEPGYAQMRQARMQSLRLVDLPRLAAHRRRVKDRTRADPKKD
ncbi:asparagine synthase [Microbacterium sp. cx-55]|uniref:asparagine synthase n=1 Tax=unclassified Microbacterium TaxID=2609290 RepID=UPI001CC03948|nr:MULTISPECIES: asparagine synthase [unclassified Microbacterium]MCC4908179.1 asparagine synthase [Microbacterium sp. cx-59]UGB35682.1 asparagine synthase [Microbacterium sp. cx-55]